MFLLHHFHSFNVNLFYYFIGPTPFHRTDPFPQFQHHVCAIIDEPRFQAIIQILPRPVPLPVEGQKINL